MSENKYSLVGWLAVALGAVTALTSIAVVVREAMIVVTGEWQDPSIGWYEVLVTIPSLISLYLLFLFRRLLNERYMYHGADRVIMLMIWISLAGLLPMFLAIGIGSMDLVIAMSVLMAVLGGIVFGVLNMRLALKLLEIKDRTNNVITAFAYLTMVAGVCYVSLIGMPLGILIEPISLVMLGMIFLREQDQVEFV